DYVWKNEHRCTLMHTDRLSVCDWVGLLLVINRRLYFFGVLGGEKDYVWKNEHRCTLMNTDRLSVCDWVGLLLILISL
ncbi:hypothetical protein, partial [Fischerella thermalis]|uniref:hypothetical protein n=1 Tax=Fischerella thermalis TaxID=372787 RepID=UPI001CA522E0